MYNAPCKWAFGHDCPYRTPECHADCPEYAKFAEKCEAMRKARGDEHSSTPELPKQVVKQIWQEQKRRRR